MFHAARTRFFGSRHHRQFAPPLRLEWLECRETPNASPVALPSTYNALITPAASAAFQGLTPEMVRRAYGFDRIIFENGVVGDGSGQTIAIVNAYHNPNAQADLAKFSRTFGLPDPPVFTQIFSPGTGYNAGWAMETSLDLQWAHAIAPNANILLVEAESAGVVDLLKAVNYARNQPGVSVVSMSWGADEFRSQSLFDGIFMTPLGHTGVSFVAASGDSGAAAGASWPAVSPNVLSVGGTRLNVDANGNYLSESAWSLGGGGYSDFVRQPGYQYSVQSSGYRSVPDVSYAADPSNGFLVYNSNPDQKGRTGWYRVGGTSAGAPQWAGLIAIANQGLVNAGGSPMPGAQHFISNLSSENFNDVTSGSNGYEAVPGYDVATGLGTPIAPNLVASLVAMSATGLQGGFVGPLPDPTTKPNKPKSNTGILTLAAVPPPPPQTFYPTQQTSSRFNDLTQRLDPKFKAPPSAPVILPPIGKLGGLDLSDRSSGGDEPTPETTPAPTPAPNAKPAEEKATPPARNGEKPREKSNSGQEFDWLSLGEEWIGFAAHGNNVAGGESDGTAAAASMAVLFGGIVSNPDRRRNIARKMRWLEG